MTQKNYGFRFVPQDVRAGALPDSAGLLATAIAWYKADSLTIADGAKVASWADSTGNGHTMLQADSTKQPFLSHALGYATVHGYAVGYAPPLGTSSTYVATATRIGNTLGTAIVVVGNLIDGAGAPAVAYDQGGGKRIVTYFDTDSKIYEGDGDDVLGAGLLLWVDGTVRVPRYDIGNTNMHIIVEQPSGAAATMSGTETRLGFGNVSFAGDIAEAIFFAAKLTSIQRQSIELYLKGKYTIA